MTTRFIDRSRFATLLSRGALALGVITLAACASVSSLVESDGPPRKETVYAVTGSHQLISFNAGQPRKVLSRQTVTGLQAGENIMGIDFRVSRGVLYALGSTGRLYTLDTRTAALRQVGAAPSGNLLAGNQFGFDFNPTVDRIRVVSNSTLNMRLHPDTGAAVDADANTPGLQLDGPLNYAPGDVNAGKVPHVVAAAYTYNKANDKITTNYAIDSMLGTLVMQGSREGVTPAVSPNTGRLTTVGSLGLGELQNVSFDISDLTNAPLVSARVGSGPARLYLLDLATGKASVLGTIGEGEALRGIAIEP